LFDRRDIAYGGTGDPVAALIFCGRNFTANDVICNGEIRVKNKKLIAFDEKAIFDEAERIFKRDITPHL